MKGKATDKAGFTLLEILVAVVILGMTFIVIWKTFAATIDGWTRGTKFLEEMHHGDFVMDQLVSSLRSAAFYASTPDKYGFWLEAKGGQYPRDTISWVSSSMAFMPPDSDLRHGLHRLEVTIDDNEDGDDSFTVSAWSHFAEREEVDPEPMHITSKVRGLECEVYDFENETWDDEWEDTNAVPRLIRITLLMQAPKKYDPPMKLSRLIEIPIAPAVTGAVVEAQQGGDGQPVSPGPQGDNTQQQPQQQQAVPTEGVAR